MPPPPPPFTEEEEIQWRDSYLAESRMAEAEEVQKKGRQFLKEVSRVVVKTLDPFRKPDQKRGHIKTTEDFKHLAKKVRQKRVTL